MAGRPLFLQTGIRIIRTNSSCRRRPDLVAAQSYYAAAVSGVIGLVVAITAAVVFAEAAMDATIWTTAPVC